MMNLRAVVLVGLAIFLVVSQLWVVATLVEVNRPEILFWDLLGLFCLVLFIAVSFSSTNQLRSALQAQEKVMQSNSQLLEESSRQRDQLASAMVEQAEGNARLRLLESAVVHARDAVIVLEAEPSRDMGRSVLYVNQAFSMITGYTPEEVIGRSLHFLRGPRSDHQTLELLRQALATNSCLQTELLNYRKDGSEVWVELNLVPVYESADSPLLAHWVMIQRDVTDRKRAEEALRSSEQRLRAIYENTTTGVMVARPCGEIVEVNPAFAKMLGYEISELLDRNVVDFTHPDDHIMQREKLNQVRKRNLATYNIQKRYLNKSGQVVWADLYCHVLPEQAGDPVSVIGIVLDITERKRTQEALRRSEERYRWLFDFSPQPMCVIDRMNLRFLAVNEAAISKYEYTREEFLQHSLSDITLAEDHPTLRQKLLALIASDKEKVIWHHRSKAGITLHVEVTASDLPNPIGTTTSTLLLLTDVTEKQHLEEQLRQAQKMEAIGQLAGGIAHDFNNLLTGIVGNLALIELSQDDQNRSLVHTAEKAAQRAAELTRKLLGFARRNQLLLAPVRVQELFQEVMGLLRRIFDPRIELVGVVNVQDPILADATLLNQALLNLCINSRDAMPHGGRLTLRADYLEVNAELAKHHPEAQTGSYIRLMVQDTGTGMSPEIAQRVFEPFFTTKPVGQGTGLGLPMVHGILKQHSGWVGFESSLDQGTTFSLYLPRQTTRSGDESAVIRLATTQREVPLDTVTPRPLRRSPPPPPPPSNSRKPTILLVDDEEMIRDIARLSLESAGYAVQEARDGLEGVETFQKNWQNIDLVLLDLTMPRLSGRDAFSQMLAIDPSARILFASGYSTDDVSDLNGAIGLLPKPYRPQDLQQAIRQALSPQPASLETA